MTTHTLKTNIGFVFDGLWRGTKLFECRRDDRPGGFAVGDILELIEWDADESEATGRSVQAKVTYVLKGERWGIMDGFAVLGIKRLSTTKPVTTSLLPEPWPSGR